MLKAKIRIALKSDKFFVEKIVDKLISATAYYALMVQQ